MPRRTLVSSISVHLVDLARKNHRGSQYLCTDRRQNRS
ncbi:TPA: hypothetical protein N0F65_005037 [Lagenidium giganteum]|uniref:Uncharacterized protein n=1 Tax=Lagenidium giganteum TaxID=4803 RepID=A0AAV2ZLD0_9STRA|nr:TPA: hypothetical protein N0F65_005037 [Lagenidium giganteum]